VPLLTAQFAFVKAFQKIVRKLVAQGYDLQQKAITLQDLPWVRGRAAST